MIVQDITDTGTDAPAHADGKKYLPAERQDIILGMLSRGIVVRVDELAEALDTTAITVRRDLNTLAAAGLIRRVRGGATALGDDTAPAPSTPPITTSLTMASQQRPANRFGSTGPATAGFAAHGTEPMVPALTGTIGVMFPEPSFNWPLTLQTMEKEAAAHELTIEVRANTYDNCDERSIVEELMGNSSLIGLVLAPSAHLQTPDGNESSDIWRWIADAPVPVVLAEREAPLGITNPDMVCTDYLSGVKQVVQRFLDLGHRRIGLALTHTPVSSYIRHCWNSIIEDAPLESSFCRTDVAPYDAVGTESIVAQAIAEGTTAMLVHSDWLAMSLAQTFERHHMAVPADVSIISVDGYIAPSSRPITAMRSPHQELGRACVDLLIDRYMHPDRPKQRVMISPEFIERGSVAAARR